MQKCERSFGLINCGALEEDVCAMALNEALNGGKVDDNEGFENSLSDRGFTYVLRIYVAHSLEKLRDGVVVGLVPESYRECLARETIARVAKSVLEEMSGDELPDLDTLAIISFELNNPPDSI